MAPPGRTGNRPKLLPHLRRTLTPDMTPTVCCGQPSRPRTADRSCPKPLRAPRLLPRWQDESGRAAQQLQLLTRQLKPVAQHSPSPATRSAGPQQGKKKPTWQPLPKPKTTDFIVVLKPRTRLSLTAVFPENGAGSALIAHLGANANQLVTVVMARDQNLILAYIRRPAYCGQTDWRTQSSLLSRTGALFGYLRADTQDSCYVVVTVRSTDSKAELEKRLYWPEGEILHIRRLGTTNKVRLTFSGKVKPRYVTYDALLILVHPYKKTIPACSQCGSVGHRPDACPGPKPDLCGTCGNSVPLMDGARRTS
ncbi:hypothetical protein HPB49_005936 [Dermacentor silvarum]|uniref:Uncharacterized protein n=1 Tax=Dermacentor silvarum TaxID=543639 RepID=A0ACB8DW47_DERSI|nr:hypothetical protein HPB49_005936 [Dermacentor silvarum]